MSFVPAGVKKGGVIDEAKSTFPLLRVHIHCQHQTKDAFDKTHTYTHAHTHKQISSTRERQVCLLGAQPVLWHTHTQHTHTAHTHSTHTQHNTHTAQHTQHTHTQHTCTHSTHTHTHVHTHTRTHTHVHTHMHTYTSICFSDSLVQLKVVTFACTGPWEEQ